MIRGPENRPDLSSTGTSHLRRLKARTECRHVADGESSFALDYVDGVPTVAGLPTHANGRVRFTGVGEGRYRLVERTSHARSDVFTLSGSGLVLFRVIEFVPENGAGGKP